MGGVRQGGQKNGECVGVVWWNGVVGVCVGASGGGGVSRGLQRWQVMRTVPPSLL